MDPAVQCGMAEEPGRKFRPPGVRHLSPAEIAGYLDAVTDPVSRQRIEAHLVRCDACLDEVLTVLRVLRPAPPAPPG
jgi:hypothetical protein